MDIKFRITKYLAVSALAMLLLGACSKNNIYINYPDEENNGGSSGFDPEFNSQSMDSLIEEVITFPFSVINGQVYGDVSMKDSLYWGSGWAWDDTPAGYQPDNIYVVNDIRKSRKDYINGRNSVKRLEASVFELLIQK